MNYSYVPVAWAEKLMLDDCKQEDKTSKRVCNNLIYQFEFEDGKQPDSIKRYRVHEIEKPEAKIPLASEIVEEK